MSKIPVPIRIEEWQVEKLKQMKIDLPDLVRTVVSMAVRKDVCPMCKREIDVAAKDPHQYIKAKIEGAKNER